MTVERERIIEREVPVEVPVESSGSPASFIIGAAVVVLLLLLVLGYFGGFFGGGEAVTVDLPTVTIEP